MRWYALPDVPPAIRATLEATWTRWNAKDAALDGTLSMVHDDPMAAQQAGMASRALANRSRVPVLVQVVHDAHGISWRASWRAVGLFLGLHPSHIQRLFYRRPQ